MPQLIGAIFYAIKSMSLYPETRFLLHALKSENSRVLLLRACLYKKSNFANPLLKAWPIEWTCP
jgi:hypothetical protein